MTRKTYIFALVWLGLTATANAALAADTNSPGSYDETIRLNPKVAKGYIDRGAAYLRQGMNESNLDNAISDFCVAIQLNPGEALAYEYRGTCNFLKNNLGEAISDVTEAIRLNPTNSINYLNRGGVYRVKGELEKAIADHTEALRLNPTNDTAYKARASLYADKEDFVRAIADLNEGLILNRKDPPALSLHGYILSKTGEFQKALDDFHEALRLDPKCAPAYNNLGWLRATCPIATMRNGQEAIEASTKACEFTKWKNCLFIDSLAACYAEFGDFERAIKYQTQALGMKSMSQKDRVEMEGRLALYKRKQPFRQTRDH